MRLPTAVRAGVNGARSCACCSSLLAADSEWRCILAPPQTNDQSRAGREACLSGVEAGEPILAAIMGSLKGGPAALLSESFLF